MASFLDDFEKKKKKKKTTVQTVTPSKAVKTTKETKQAAKTKTVSQAAKTAVNKNKSFLFKIQIIHVIMRLVLIIY